MKKSRALALMLLFTCFMGSAAFAQQTFPILSNRLPRFDQSIKKAEISRLTRSENTTSTHVDTGSSHRDTEYITVKDSIINAYKQIKSLKIESSSDVSKMDFLTHQIDTLKLYYTEEFLTTIKPPRAFFIGDISYYNIDTLNKYFYNQSTYSGLQSAFLQNFQNKTYLNTEFASALFGPVRVGLSGMFQSKGDTTKDNAIKTNLQKIITSGGSINLTASLPLFYARSQGNKAHFGVFATNNLGFTPSIIDSTGTTDYTSHVSFTDQVGFNILSDFGSSPPNAHIAFSIPVLYSFSSNDLRQQGVPNYFIVKLQAGIVFSNVMNLLVSGPIVSNNKIVQHSPWLLSLQFSPSQIVSGSKD